MKLRRSIGHRAPPLHTIASHFIHARSENATSQKARSIDFAQRPSRIGTDSGLDSSPRCHAITLACMMGNRPVSVESWNKKTSAMVDPA
jgi:hypothetical protein